MIIYLTGLTNINREMVEAGRIDGAMGFNMFWYVILPQLKPATFIATVVTVVGALRSFDMVAIMTKGDLGEVHLFLHIKCMRKQYLVIEWDMAQQ